MWRSAQDYAAYLLSRRPRSRHELEEKLQSKHYDEIEIQETLSTFERLGLINDEHFAKAYVNDKLEFNRRGKYRLFLELLKKGVAKETISQSLSKVTPEQEVAAANDLLRSRARQWQTLDELARYRRALSLLQRRGFSPAVVRQAMDRWKRKEE